MYLAKVMHTDGFSRIAAVKLLHQRWSENQEIARRMRDEARLLGWLRHRNIVDVIDLTTIGGRVAVVMEYLEAVDLKTIGTALEQAQEPMSLRAALEILAFVASALDAAYNRPPYQGERPLRVIHRDLKPSNVMVDETGTVKVLDFGVARADFDHRESHTQELQFGSIDFMPPERLFHEPETPASDVYSLGATFYEILALEKLGKARGHKERHTAAVRARLDALRPRLGPAGGAGDGIEELLLGMLAFEHTERPGAADVVHRARQLARSADGEGLIEWAERVIPPLVKEAREAPREPNPLTDSVLSEDTADSRGFEFTDPGMTDPKLAALSERMFLGEPSPAEQARSGPSTRPPLPDPSTASPRRQATPPAAPPASSPPSPPGPPPSIGALPASPGGLRHVTTGPRTQGDADATLIYTDTRELPEPEPARVSIASPPSTPPVPAPIPPAPGKPGRRGPPPPVSLDPVIPAAEDPGLLSAPFPRQFDTNGRSGPLPTVSAADLAEPATPRANPVVRSAVTRTAKEQPPDPATVLPPPRTRTAVPVDDDSDALLVTRLRASPTLIFPIEEGDRPTDRPRTSTHLSPADVAARAIPASHPTHIPPSPPTTRTITPTGGASRSVSGEEVDEADETVPAMGLRGRPVVERLLGEAEEPRADVVLAPAPFPPPGSALALPPPKPSSPAPPDPGQVSEARQGRGRAEPGPVIVQRVVVGDSRSVVGGRSSPTNPIVPAPRPVPAAPSPGTSPSSVPAPSPGTSPSTVPSPSTSVATAAFPAPIPPSSSAPAEGKRPPIVLRPPRSKAQDTVDMPVTAAPGMPKLTPRPPEPPPAKPKRSWVGIAIGALFVVAVLGVTTAWAAWTYVVAPMLAAGTGAAPEATAEATPAAPATLAADAIRFQSGAADTTRVTVTCDGREFTGDTWVDVTGLVPTSCTVRVMLKDRTRLYTDVQAPTAGVWTCFQDGGRSCAR